MAVPFSRTLRALEADSARRWTLGLLIAVALLGGWLAWFLRGQVAIYEVSDRAQLEVEAAAHPVVAEVSGRVVKSHIELGRPVRAGEVLVELDAEPERLALEEVRAWLAGLSSQIEALRREIQTEREALEAYRRATAVALEESRARIAQAEAEARFAKRRAEARQALRGQRMVSEEDLRQAHAQAEAGRAEVRALDLATARLEQESAVEVIDREARIAELERDIVELQAEAATGEVTLQRLTCQIERYRIRATIEGHLGQVQRLRVGSMVSTAQVVGSIVPPRGAARRGPVSGDRHGPSPPRPGRAVASRGLPMDAVWHAASHRNRRGR
jgi:membrane fusion protein (multidrug efflux system)